MRTVVLTLLTLLPGIAVAQETNSVIKPVILQSHCTPKENSGFDAFGFELIQSGKEWASKIYPVSGAKSAVPFIEFHVADVKFLRSPKGNPVIMLSQGLEQEGRRDSVVAISEIISNQPSPFSVTISSGAIGADGVDRRTRIRAECKFVNIASPNERVPL